MSKRSAGLFTLLTGFVAGAAAVFFAKAENRQQAAKEVQLAATNPQAFEKKMVKQGKKLAKQALKTAKRTVKVTKPVTKKTTRKTTRRASKTVPTS